MSAGENWDFASIDEKFSLAIGKFSKLLSGTEWQDTTITYSFPSKAFRGTGEELPRGEKLRYTEFTQSEQKVAKEIFDQLERSTGLTFVHDKTGHGDIKLGHQNMSAGGYAYYPDEGWSAVLVNEDYKIGRTGYGRETLIHEIGHALGLKHPHEKPELSPGLDLDSATIMSYDRLWIADGSKDPEHVFSSHMLMDILALQSLYGQSSLETDDVYKADGTLRVVSDGGGSDKIDISTWRYDKNDSNIVDLSKGYVYYDTVGKWQTCTYNNDTENFSPWTVRTAKNGFFNMIITRETTVETVIGSKVKDTITGGSWNDTIKAGAGDDVLRGGDGDDTLNGGKGHDTLVGGLGADTFVYSGGKDVIKDFNAAEGDVMLGDWPV